MYSNYYNHNGREWTTREILVAIFFSVIFILIGLWISGKIIDYVNDTNIKYETAVKIDNNHDEFSYALKTNYGHTLTYGSLKSVDRVDIDGYGGISVERVLEEYTKHYKEVCEECGTSEHPKECCHEEEYWTWDYVNSISKESMWVSFCEEKIPTSWFPLPHQSYVATKSAGFHKRHQYYVVGDLYQGTLYSNIYNHRLNDSRFIVGVHINEAVERFKISQNVKYVFWIPWIIMIVVIFAIFCNAENDWLNRN